MGGLRVKKDGERTHVISPTIADTTHRKVRSMAVAYGGTMSSVVRVAITLGLDRMDKELHKRDAGESHRCELIEQLLSKDGRKRTKGA